MYSFPFSDFHRRYHWVPTKVQNISFRCWLPFSRRPQSYTILLMMPLFVLFFAYFIFVLYQPTGSLEKTSIFTWAIWAKGTGASWILWRDVSFKFEIFILGENLISHQYTRSIWLCWRKFLQKNKNFFWPLNRPIGIYIIYEKSILCCLPFHK